MKSNNRRVSLTKQLLKNALIDLLAEKELQSITITEICKCADVNRTTFYKYFDGVPELLNSIQLDILSDVKKQMADVPPSISETELLRLLEYHFRYIHRHIHEFKVFSSERLDDFELPRQTMEILLVPYLDQLARRQSLSEKEHHLRSTFCILGVIGITKEWISGTIPCTERELAEQILKLLKNNYPTPH